MLLDVVTEWKFVSFICETLFRRTFMRLKLEYPFPCSTVTTTQKLVFGSQNLVCLQIKGNFTCLWIRSKIASCLERLERTEYRNISYIIHNLPDRMWCYKAFFFMRQTRAISEII